MNITQSKLAIRLCREAGIASFLWGHRGLGKSSLHKQVARGLNWGFLDFRCSQIEASDLRGLPDKEDGMTVYRPPADLPRGHAEDEACPACEVLEEGEEPIPYDAVHPSLFCKGILFLDEVNRAEDDVLQAAFQLVLDRQVGLYKVPAGWSVHCAGNFGDGGSYNVNNFNDAAFLDRFCHLTLDAGTSYVDDWSQYMLNTHHEHGDVVSKVVQFAAFDCDNHLVGQVSGGLDFTIQPSPRSMDAVVRVEVAVQKNPELAPVKQLVIAGLIGQALALNYDQFTCEVTPNDILDVGINKSRAVKSKLESLSRNALIGLLWAVAATAKRKSKARPWMENTLDFLEYLAKHIERDLAVSLGRNLCKEDGEELSSAMLSNPELAKLCSTYNMKSGSDLAWVNLLTERADLQDLMHQVSFGSVGTKPAKKKVKTA